MICILLGKTAEISINTLRQIQLIDSSVVRMALLSTAGHRASFTGFLALLIFVGCKFSIVGAGIHCNEKFYFSCRDDDSSCIAKGWWCDGSADCLDESDEMYCAPNSVNCPRSYFVCHDGSCIPGSGRCDGMTSCKDGSDEVNCDTTTELPAGFDAATMSSTETSSEQTFRQLLTEEPHGSKQFHTQAPLTPQATQAPLTQNSTIRNSFETSEALPASEEQELPLFSDGAVTKNVFADPRDHAVSCILSAMTADGWGEDTPRAVVSLYLSNQDFFREDTYNNTIMVKNLHVQLAMELLRNETRAISLSTLSHYINALIATCGDPRNFHGLDLVSVLRQRTNAALSGSFVNPFVYLTLCIVGESNRNDFEEMRILISSARPNLKPDLLSLAVLAASCIAEEPRTKQYYARAGLHMLRQNSAYSLISNIYTTPLILQALDYIPMADDWERLKREATKFVLDQQDEHGCFGDQVANYYAMPVLSGNTLESLKLGCRAASRGVTAVEVLRKNADTSNIKMRYSLYLGNKVDVSHTIELTIPNGATVFDVIRLAEQENRIFGFKYEVSRGYPTVFSIGGHPNDAEQGTYWLLYKESPSSASQSNLIPVTDDMTRIIVQNEDHFVFWYKSRA